MPYTFLDLVNELAERVNEVPLTSSNFSTAIGFYKHAKRGVNRALRDIDIRERFWSWNFTQGSQTLTAGTLRYSLPSDAKVVDFDSFVIPEDTNLNNNTRWLRPVTYDDYKQNYVWWEHDTDTSNRMLPTNVVKTPSREFIVFPTPDQAYEVRFDYFATFTEMTAYDDVPIVPERYRTAVINGAMRDVSLFRENQETAAYYEEQFKKNVEDMRIEEINKDTYVRSSMRFWRNPAYKSVFFNEYQ